MPRSDPGPCVLHAGPWLLALVQLSGLLSQPGLGLELADSLISRAQERWPEVRLVHLATGKPLHLRSRCFGDGLVGLDPLN